MYIATHWTVGLLQVGSDSVACELLNMAVDCPLSLFVKMTDNLQVFLSL